MNEALRSQGTCGTVTTESSAKNVRIINQTLNLLLTLIPLSLAWKATLKLRCSHYVGDCSFLTTSNCGHKRCLHCRLACTTVMALTVRLAPLQLQTLNVRIQPTMLILVAAMMTFAFNCRSVTCERHPRPSSLTR